MLKWIFLMTYAAAQGFVPEADSKRWESAEQTMSIAGLEGLKLGQSAKSDVDSEIKAKAKWRSEGSRERACFVSTDKNKTYLIIEHSIERNILTGYEIHSTKPAQATSCVASKQLNSLNKASLSPRMSIEDLKKILGEPLRESERGLSYSFEQVKPHLDVAGKVKQESAKKPDGTTVLEKLVINAKNVKGKIEGVSVAYSAEYRPPEPKSGSEK